MRDLRIRYDLMERLWKIVELKNGMTIAVLFEGMDLKAAKLKLEELK